MNKNILRYVALAFIAFTFSACQEEDQEFGPVTAPSNLSVSFEVVGANADNPQGDGSGFVTFSATADDAITYRFNFGDNTDVEVAPNGETTHRFTQTGVNTYTVAIIATGTGGAATSTTVSLDVFSAFDDPEAKMFLAGGEGQSKTWYWADATPGHLGVGPSVAFDIQINGGPSQYHFPAFFAAAPGQICGGDFSHCLCTDELVFSLDASGQLTYELNNNGETFFNGGHQEIVGGDGNGDQCFAFDTTGTSFVSLSPTTIDYTIADPEFMARGTTMNFSDDAFMGYYLTASTYDILELTEDTMHVRVKDGLNPDLAWYHKFTTTPPGDGVTGCTGETGDSGSGDFTTLVWSDEFDEDGAPCDGNWRYEIGTGDNGWGNGESQYYTDRAENVKVENGVLKITAQAENFQGSNYTSSRITTQDKYEFQYGRVEARAKLPTGAGTWPAIWLFGANFETVTWPACGEIDIMEHVGNQQNTIYGALHYPGNSGGNANISSTQNPTASDEFHVYAVEWNAQTIKWFIDGVEFKSFNNNTNVPFNHDFFIILNVAMGGNFGGNIDPNFTESSMEIDYIRVYQ